MGGFHGGHSSGGGFHGGHSSGGFHGGHSRGGYHSSRSSSHHHSTFIYVGGRSYSSSGSNNNSGYKKPSLITSIILGVLIGLIGITLFLSIYRKACTATITYTDYAYDGVTYEVYDFEYSMYGKTYIGHGDDDLIYNRRTNSYEFSVKVGEHYTIYARLLSPDYYSFESDNGAAFVLLFIGLGIGVMIIANTFNNLKLYKKRLESIGDLNGDGKLDEKDIEIYLSRKSNIDNKKEELQNRVCPYCDSLVSINDRFCQQCGAPLGKKNE